MKLNCGIVGLPNVGKSTLFSALTATEVDAQNYPFCTIDPNVGVVSVPDTRLKKLIELFGPQKTIPAVVDFVDIAGLVKGASQGEGLGNQFLSHIRNVDLIVHVVRCFEDSNVTHVNGKIDPLGDIDTINLELVLSDLQSVEKKIANVEKAMKGPVNDKTKEMRRLFPVLQKVKKVLDDGRMALQAELEEEELGEIKELGLLTLKNQVMLCNVSEDDVGEDNVYVKKVRDFGRENSFQVLKICGQIEKEISLLESEEDRNEFMESIGLDESGLDILIRTAYHSLGLRTFFTCGEKEVRAWTFKDGSTAPQAAGIIHSDMERGFIRAETYHYNDIVEDKTEAKVKEKGKMRIEGKEYIVQDGDILHFRFNV